MATATPRNQTEDESMSKRITATIKYARLDPDPGKYTLTVVPDTGSRSEEIWRVFRGHNKRWYGECIRSEFRTGYSVDAATLRQAKYDIRNGFVIGDKTVSPHPITEDRLPRPR